MAVDLNAIADRLRECAVGEDDLAHVWKLDVSDELVRVTATTVEVSDTPEAAFRSALALRDLLLGEEYRLQYQTRLGVVGEIDPDLPQWRGTVVLALQSR